MFSDEEPEEAEFIENETDDDGEEEEEDNGEAEVNEGYGLRFCREMDPIDFALRDSSNGDDEIYKNFERLDYEALAERKRKALFHHENCDKKKKRLREEEGAAMEVINEFMNYGRRRRSKKPKKRGRKKGSKKNLSPEVARKIGDATLHYASENYDEAILILEEVVRLAPCTPDGYYLLGLIYDAKCDRKKALIFHIFAAHLTPKDSSLWKKLVAWSIEESNTGQVRYCLSKAITADPEDVALKFDLASLYFELEEYQKAAGLYSQIVGQYPGNILARKMAAKMFQRCGLLDKAIDVLEDFVNNHFPQDDRTIIDLLITLQMESNEHTKALHHIDHACAIYGPGKKLPLYLKAKATICHAYLGNLDHAKNLLKDVEMEQAKDQRDLITEVASTFMNLGHYDYALNFYFLLERTTGHENGGLHLKIAECYMSLKERRKAIPFFRKALSAEGDNIDVRITLSSLLLEESEDNEAIRVLSSSKSSEPISCEDCAPSESWLLNGKVKVQLAKIYHAKGMLEDFVRAILPVILKTLEVMNQKLKKKARKNDNRRSKELSRGVRTERPKTLNDQLAHNPLYKMKPCAIKSKLVQAHQPKMALEGMPVFTKEKEMASIADGTDMQLGEKAKDEHLLPGLLQDDENHQLILDLCQALFSLCRYSDSVDIINLTLKLAHSTLSFKKKEEFLSLGLQITIINNDSKHGYRFAKYFVQKYPWSRVAWNDYYKVVPRVESSLKRGDCVYPLIIEGHAWTAGRHGRRRHQNAAEKYLAAYKLQPENPLINLCAGTALINLAVGGRIGHCRHRCIVQAFAFIHEYMRICNNSQEAMYNVARAYHHVGLVTLAVSYYEKVLAMKEKDYPIPKLPHEKQKSLLEDDKRGGYCNLHGEAAFNLHLIYKKSGAVDLARQILKNYCTP